VVLARLLLLLLVDLDQVGLRVHSLIHHIACMSMSMCMCM
jgi:hypothetical protein